MLATVSFSGDGKHSAYAARRAKKDSFVVLDGKVVFQSERSTLCRLLPDGRLVCEVIYDAEEAGKNAYLVEDGKEHKKYYGIDKLRVVSPDGKRFAYFGLPERLRRCVVVDGVEVCRTVPEENWQALTLLRAIRSEGLAGSLAFPGATDTEAFTTYIAKVLLPSLRRGDGVILDRLNVHKAARVQELVESVGAQIKLLPPYSPDLNPIEKMWSKVKEHWRAAKTRTTEALHQAIRAALRTVSQLDIRHWFGSCGYGTPNSKPL